MHVILHIGTGKTGTSSLQSYCAANRSRLRDIGITYPELDASPSHRLLVETVRRAPVATQRALAGQLQKHDGTILLSSEAISGLRKAEHVASLVDMVGGSATVVVYVRHQIDFLLSLYAQDIRHPEVRSPDTVPAWFRRRRTELNWRFDYESLLNRWRETVGDDRVLVRPYDPRVLVHGDVIDDLFSAIGYEEGARFDRGAVYPNKRLSTLALAALRVLNQQQVSAESRFRLMDTIAQIDPAIGDDSYHLVPAKLATRIQDRWDESNARVAAAVGIPNGVLFPSGAQQFEQPGAPPAKKVAEFLASLALKVVDTQDPA